MKVQITPIYTENGNDDHLVITEPVKLQGNKIHFPIIAKIAPGKESQANRIMACTNACAGISTENLNKNIMGAIRMVLLDTNNLLNDHFMINNRDEAGNVQHGQIRELLKMLGDQ